jgi:biopolymer transport protein ExbD
VAIKIPQDEGVEVNLTPVIDMVFLLLIFFLVATKFADIERDVRVHPPTSRNARPVTAIPEEIVVNVTESGALLVAGRERSLDELERLFLSATESNPHQAVVIRGDRNAILHRAVDVLDLCEKHNVEKTYLTTQQAGGSGQ